MPQFPPQPIHGVAWIDRHEARLFLLKGDGSTPGEPDHRIHRQKDSGPVRDDREFFEEILAALEPVESWTIAGPDSTRHDLEKYLDGHAEELRGKLLGVEAMDQPSPSDLAARARAFAAAVERSS